MAKTKTRRRGEAAADVDELLDLTAETSAESAEKEAAPSPPIAPRPAELTIERSTLEVPLAQFRPEVRQFSHVEALLTPAQGRVLRRLFDALDRDHLRMANGKHVGSAADCVRWLLDRLGEQGQ